MTNKLSQAHLMPICFIVVLLVIFSISVNAKSSKNKLIEAHKDFFSDYEMVVQKFNREINLSLYLRGQSSQFYQQEISEGEEQYFNSQDLLDIRDAVAAYKINREILLNDIAYRYRPLLKNVELVFTLTEKSGLKFIPATERSKRKNQVVVNPNDELGRQYIKVFKLGLASALTLYDNFIIAIMPYQRNGHFRRSVDYDNFENGSIIEEISGNFRNLDNYKDTLKVVEFNGKVQAWENSNPKHLLLLGKDNDYFNVLINGSFSNERIKSIDMMENIGFRTVRFRQIVKDTLFGLGSDSMNLVSQLFGNTMGLVATRQGYLKQLSQIDVVLIKSQLLPGDILLEKTPFRLTDRFIPGHWGHVAIWAGTEKQLKSLEVWDELPRLYQHSQKVFSYQGNSFQQQVKEGKMIVEALRSGVQINTLDDFLNIDDLAVLRAKKVSDKSMKQYLLRAFEQIGKEYDFNFDVETDKKIVCSELAFVSYYDYPWPVAKTAGRYTISPDHVAEKALMDGPLKPVILYHDGKVIENKLLKNFTHLMRGEYQAVGDYQK